jgi:hypothetical protein
VLEQLTRFVRSEEIPGDAREGMDMLLAWWKLHSPRLSQAKSIQFNQTVLGFLRDQLGVTPSADGHQHLNSALLLPHSQSSIPAPDLAPKVYTTKQLAHQLPSTTDTLKRQARSACEKGQLPQPLPGFPEWHVVAMSAPRGGRNRGWMFQRLLKPEGT